MSSWRRSPLAPLWSCQGGDPQIEGRLYKRSSHTAVKVIGPSTDFPTEDSARGWEHQGIWLWRSLGFDYRTSTVLGKQRCLEGTNKILCAPEPRTKEGWPHKRLSQACLWALGSPVQVWANRGLQKGQGHRQEESWEVQHVDRSLLQEAASGQTTGREQSPTHQQKTGLKMYWAWTCPPAQDPVFSTTNPSH